MELHKKSSIKYEIFSPFSLIYIPVSNDGLEKIKNFQTRELSSDYPFIREELLRVFPELNINASLPIYEVFDKYNIHKLYIDWEHYLEITNLDLSSEVLKQSNNFQIIG